MRRPILLLSVLALFALVAAGCGDSGKTADIPDGSGAATGTQASEAPATTETETADADAAATAPQRDKPKIDVPDGPPPKKLVVKDLIEGTGPAVKAGDTVDVDYVGVLYENGKQFDASYDRGEPFTFPLGAGQVIQGWDQGVEGMKVGGRRELIIPAQLAYGKQGAGEDIPPNSALIFVVDLRGKS